MGIWTLGQEDSPRERNGNPVFLPGKPHGQRSLVGSSPWDCKRVRDNLATKQQQRICYLPGLIFHIIKIIFSNFNILKFSPVIIENFVMNNPGLGRSPGGCHGNPLQYSLPGKSHGQRSLAGHTVHSITKSQTWLKWLGTNIFLTF